LDGLPPADAVGSPRRRAWLQQYSTGTTGGFMKKALAAAILLSGAMVMSQAALADEGAIKGTLVKLDGMKYTVKDEKGKEHTYDADDKTKKRGGEFQVGSTIELYIGKDGKISMVETIKK
jgi:hypothetical protein